MLTLCPFAHFLNVYPNCCLCICRHGNSPVCDAWVIPVPEILWEQPPVLAHTLTSSWGLFKEHVVGKLFPVQETRGQAMN